jgi:hypothetical protein
MPLVPYYRARRIWKAKRKKAKPKWQDQDPGTKEGRDAYAIAAKYEQTFAKAFLEAIRNQITPEIEKDFRKAWKTGSPAAVINSIPFFEENPDSPMWQKFLDRLSTAYLTVIQAAGDEATKDLNKALGTKLEFDALLTEETEEIIQKLLTGNRYSADWVRRHGLELVADGISPQQKQVVSNIIQESMEAGGRATETLDNIKANIGLTSREYQATVNRMNLHLDSGLPEGEAKALTDKYRDKLLRGRAQRIARTETIRAQAQGRKDAWLVAQDEGKLPPVERMWLAPPPSPNPNLPCDICLDLDGRTAKINEPYEGTYGSFEGPPAHPSCRCTEVLQKPGKIPAKPIGAPIERPAARVLTSRAFIGRPKPKPPRMPEVREFMAQPRSGKRIQLSAQQQGVDQSARYLAKSEKRFLRADRKQRQDFLQWNWVHGSNRKFAVRMKEAAKREFGLKGVIRNPRGFRISNSQVEDIRKDLRDMYRKTQEDFKARGIKKVRLYRGVQSNVTTPGALESWTTDPDIAKSFGSNVMVKEVPVEKILNYRGSRNWVDGVWGNQQEYMVMS